MTDQCKHCTVRGDLKKCLSTDCHHHENWYAKEQQKKIDDLQDFAIWLTGCGYDFCQHDYFCERRDALLLDYSHADSDACEQI